MWSVKEKQLLLTRWKVAWNTHTNTRGQKQRVERHLRASFWRWDQDSMFLYHIFIASWASNPTMSKTLLINSFYQSSISYIYTALFKVCYPTLQIKIFYFTHKRQKKTKTNPKTTTNHVASVHRVKVSSCFFSSATSSVEGWEAHLLGQVPQEQYCLGQLISLMTRGGCCHLHYIINRSIVLALKGKGFYENVIFHKRKNDQAFNAHQKPLVCLISLFFSWQ